MPPLVYLQEKTNSKNFRKPITNFRHRYYPDVTVSDWNDWQWQLRNRICTLKELERFVQLSDDERQAFTEHSHRIPFAITPYYASLLDPENADQPIRRTMVPSIKEYIKSKGEAEDPLGEEGHSPVQSLVHRYPDRVLFLSTNFCASNCRYCTRSRMVGDHDKAILSRENWQQAIDYIAEHDEVRDVVISGGDFLTLTDDSINWLLAKLRTIPHLEILRIGTKVPAVLPQRITQGLLRILRQYHPLFLSLHFTHPDELTDECVAACNRLADAGLPLGSQTVLLKGINDDVDTQRRLYHGLLKARVRPYYLYQCDPIIGSSHFRTDIEKGLEITRGLRGFTSGYAIPTFVIDAPGGGGKIPLLPEYRAGEETDSMLLRNYEDKTFRYPK
ncbi:MAG: KamA family radical SAM protein [Fibrobacteres bacterium]|nr:KamA family radical SAM protein [Fibrobacterota bacterium]